MAAIVVMEVMDIEVMEAMDIIPGHSVVRHTMRRLLGLTMHRLRPSITPRQYITPLGFIARLIFMRLR